MEEAYTKIKNRPLSWNYNVLRQLRRIPISRMKLSKEEILSQWQKFKHLLNSGHQEKFERYIDELFDFTNEDLGRKFPHQFRDEIICMLSTIFRSFSNEELIMSDPMKIISNMCGILRRMKYCSDRQVDEIRFAYYLVDGKVDPNSTLETFIKYTVAEEKEKERIFEIVVTPPNKVQNVHVLNYWKYKMRNEIGFDFELKSRVGTMNQDRFQRVKGNTLYFFYSKFTPEHMITILTEQLNSVQNKRQLNEAASIIFHSSDEILFRECFDYENNEKDIFEYSGINKTGTKYLLIHFSIINKSIIHPLMSICTVN